MRILKLTVSARQRVSLEIRGVHIDGRETDPFNSRDFRNRHYLAGVLAVGAGVAVSGGLDDDVTTSLVKVFAALVETVKTRAGSPHNAYLVSGPCTFPSSSV